MHDSVSGAEHITWPSIVYIDHNKNALYSSHSPPLLLSSHVQVVNYNNVKYYGG